MSTEKKEADLIQKVLKESHQQAEDLRDIQIQSDIMEYFDKEFKELTKIVDKI